MSRFVSIFKDDNDWNEKTVSRLVQEFIYNSFLIITLGCFSISGIEKWAPKRDD